MIDIQLIPEGWERIDAWIGVFNDEELIRVGCSDYKGWDHLIREGYAIKELRKYRDAYELILGTAVEAITHETLHIILKRWFGLGASGALDNVDKGGKISRLRF